MFSKNLKSLALKTKKKFRLFVFKKELQNTNFKQ